MTEPTDGCGASPLLRNVPTGTLSGYLEILGRAENDEHGRARFLCLCRAPACGKRLVVQGRKLRQGQRSCGCRRRVPEAPADIVEPVRSGIG